MFKRAIGIVLCLAVYSSVCIAQTPRAAVMQAPSDVKPMSPTLEDVPYPYPVHYLPLMLYGHDVRMAYMDAPPAGAANGHVVVLLHGMNFYGEYWSGTIEILRAEGFRVVVPEKIGFGRSTKAVIPYNV